MILHRADLLYGAVSHDNRKYFFARKVVPHLPKPGHNLKNVNDLNIRIIHCMKHYYSM
jgi:hypothetical protein